MSPTKRLVVFNQSAGYLMVDIINANSADYDEVILITGNFNPRQTPLRNNVKIKKIIQYDRKSMLKRLITWFVGYVQMSFLALMYQRYSHFLIVSNPPMSFFIPLRCVRSYSLLVYDIYPNALIDFNYVRSTSVWVKLWKRRNMKIYGNAKFVYTISEGMKSLLTEYVASEKIQVVPVWTDNHFFCPVPKADNPFLKKHSLQQKFIVQYSGNLGKTHNVEVLLRIADKISDKDIHFLIIGEGTQKGYLQRQAKEANLSNVSFFPWQETSMLPVSLAAADIGLVSLGTDASNLSVPSKTFNLMSVGVPILCLASQESELARLVRKYDFGMCFHPSDLDLMIEYILTLKTDLKRRGYYAERALLASRDFTPDNAILIK